jgi:hypothetical protein
MTVPGPIGPGTVRVTTDATQPVTPISSRKSDAI